MKTPRLLLSVILVAVAYGAAGQRVAKAPRASGEPAIEKRVDSLLAIMTLEEKIGQLNQLGATEDTVTHERVNAEQQALIGRGLVGSMLNVTGAAETRKIQEIAVSKTRLHIPLIFGLDVIHGFRTVFPIPLAEACTWDPAAVERSARIGAEEASATGIHWTFAPMVDIARDPRWGRIAEGSGEDPHLGSVMATARVRGFQGKDLRLPQNVLACAKHFAAYGGAEAGRDYNTVDISERTLREVYLPPFKAAVDAGAGSLMSSFNEIGGIPSTANHHTLTGILRGEWKFKGFVVSDWTSIGELLMHGIAGDTADAARLALTAGVDMDMASGVYLRALPSLVKNGRVPVKVVDGAVRRILREKFALGLFENPYRNCDTLREANAFLRPEYRKAAREIADESIVLLKNEGGLLPIRPGTGTIALIGPLAADSSAPLGPWHGAGRPSDVVSLLDGVRRRAGPSTSVVTVRGCDIDSPSTAHFKEAVDAARQADMVVLVLGESAEMSGEASSRSFIGLPGVQEDLAKVIIATGKPTVVVLLNGRPLAIPWLALNAQAIVEAWFPGVEAGNAVADVLFGDVNPQGKLTATFPRSAGQIPIYYDHKNTGRPLVESDKFTSRYIDLPNTPLYPFGYGMSYTSFSYSNVRLKSASVKLHDSVRVAIDVKNTGQRAGTEIVELYVRDEVASVTRPVQELKGFARVTLNPGEERTVAIVVATDQLGFFNSTMMYVVEPGWFQVMVGGSSDRTIQTRFQLRK